MLIYSGEGFKPIAATISLRCLRTGLALQILTVMRMVLPEETRFS